MAHHRSTPHNTAPTLGMARDSAPQRMKAPNLPMATNTLSPAHEQGEGGADQGCTKL